MSDQEIARLLRKSHRRATGRKNAAPGGNPPKWTAAEDRLLGKWPDDRVARFLGRTEKAVEGRRLRLGIRFSAPPPRWTPEEERLLDPAAAGGKRTIELARQLGRSVAAIRMQRRLKYGRMFQCRKWTKRELRLLGTRPDREVAALLKRTYETVQVKRHALGIASYRARNKFRWTPGKDRLLGTLADHTLGERFGCGRKAVGMRRRALKIPPIRNSSLAV